MPQATEYVMWRKRPAVERLYLPTDLLSVNVTAPTVIKAGAGVYYGFHIGYQPDIPSQTVLRISDTDNSADRWPGRGDEFVDFLRVDAGYQSFFPYNRPPWRDWIIPPYGQLVIPFKIGLSVLSIPPGMSVTIWYT
jgi:hypothetical protein